MRSMFTAAGLALAALLCAPAHAQEALNPPFYVVRDADSTMYLFGTVHIRPRGADWGNDRVRAAISEAQEVWTEIEMSPEAEASVAALTLQMAATPAGRPLSSWLTNQERAQLGKALTRLGMPPQALENQEPWMAALMLSVLPLMQAGFDPESGVDRSVDAYADAQGKTMRAFESAAQQLGLFDEMTPEVQRAMLREAIVQAPGLAAMMRQLTTAWETGDEATLTALVIDDSRENYPELYQTIFVQRNNAWMETMVAELQGSGVDFVAVGAGHLLGDEGLVAQLRAHSYSVERVN